MNLRRSETHFQKTIARVITRILTVIFIEITLAIKVGCVFPMIIVTILRHAEFGQNDHWVDAIHFISSIFTFLVINLIVFSFGFIFGLIFLLGCLSCLLFFFSLFLFSCFLSLCLHCWSVFLCVVFSFVFTFGFVFGFILFTFTFFAFFLLFIIIRSPFGV